MISTQCSTVLRYNVTSLLFGPRHCSHTIETDYEAKVREELRALPVQEDGFPSLADIEAAPLFDAFIREVYRVNPGSSGRQERYIPESGKEYNGVYLPQGVCCRTLIDFRTQNFPP